MFRFKQSMKTTDEQCLVSETQIPFDFFSSGKTLKQRHRQNGNTVAAERGGIKKYLFKPRDFFSNEMKIDGDS